MYIFNQPHTSTSIPHKTGYLISNQELKTEINLFTDWGVTEIFHFPQEITLQPQFSRVFCDVERLPDKDEPMFQKGSGIVYTHLDSGKLMRQLTAQQKNKIITDYYLPFQQQFFNLTNEKLKKNDAVTIFVGGATLSGSRDNKTDILNYVITKSKISPADSIMIGDKEHDIFGAHAVHMDSIGVTYGYGTLEELQNAQPTYIVSTIAQLVEKLR